MDLQLILLGLLAIALGLVFCLYGYRLFMILLPVWGFIAGFYVGASGIAIILGEGFLATVTGWIVGAIFGLIAAILSYFIYSFGVYLLLFTFGLGLGAGIIYAIGIESGLVVTIAAFAVAIGLGAAAYYLNVKKWLIVAITALAGAGAIVGGILLLLDKVSLGGLQEGENPIRTVMDDSIIWLLLWLVFSGLAIYYQARTTEGFLLEAEAEKLSV